MDRLTDTHCEECPRFDHVYKHGIALSQVSRQPKPFAWGTWVPIVIGLVNVTIQDGTLQ